MGLLGIFKTHWLGSSMKKIWEPHPGVLRTLLL